MESGSTASEETTAATENEKKTAVNVEGTVEEGSQQNAGSETPAQETFEKVSRAPKGVQITVKTLMDAGAHFGHQCERWNPKMLPYIYGKRNSVYIINLDKTVEQWKRARQVITNTVSQGGSILFVGTKQQARDIVKEEATRCGAFSVTTRWLGGTLSNFQTIKRSIERMRRLESLVEQAEEPDSKVKINKKERLTISRDIEKLSDSLGGIREMRKLPNLIFIVDLNKEDIAVAEARRLRIPIVALVDTNVDPDLVQYPIASNDDASKSIRLFSEAVADAVLEGKGVYESRRPAGSNNQ